MKLVSYLEKKSDLEIFKENEIKEVLISPLYLTRMGKSSLEDTHFLAKEAKKTGLKTVLVWDIVMTEEDFQEAVFYFKKIDLSYFDAIRVQDPGAIQWIQLNTKHPIQLILETGNRNILGIQKWISSVERLEKVIFSIELSKEMLLKTLSEISVPVEILVMGPILLFYSPRALLSFDKKSENLDPLRWIEAKADSEEGFHHDFKVIENKHGTFMFLPRELCLLDKIDELKQMNIESFRIDLRHQSTEKFLPQIKKLIENFNSKDWQDFKKNYPEKLIRGFYAANKSDILFKKLKNQNIQRVDKNYLGEVLEAKKGSYLVLKIKSKTLELKMGSHIKFKTTTGKEVVSKVTQLRNSRLELIDSASHGAIVIVNPVNAVTVKSAVYQH
ncbi:MAG: hypothetical protein CL678_05950 [Bdellovibrionaceae bacterium]|nr:hypothetical protein [Pseudobdellovibrionaceae bacterium]|tara:strand:- start:590 stop:1747 length:1158 start_codon:yes stop_codon:yes gene_type:complete